MTVAATLLPVSLVRLGGSLLPPVSEDVEAAAFDAERASEEASGLPSDDVLAASPDSPFAGAALVRIVERRTGQGPGFSGTHGNAVNTLFGEAARWQLRCGNVQRVAV